MNKIVKYLNQHIAGDVYGSAYTLEAYATDKSLMAMKPQAVIMPKNTHDIRKVVRFCYQLAEKNVKIGLTLRGCGNDKTGAAIGKGIVLDTSAYMNEILEIDPKQRLVRVQPGITVGELNRALSLYNLWLPCTPAYTQHTIGGMIANNLGNDMGGDYGKISNFVEKAEVVLSNGDVIQTGKHARREVNRKKGQQTFEGEIYRGLTGLLDDKDKIIEEFLADDDVDNTGYESIADVRNRDGAVDLLPLLCASQGTLGIISEVILSVDFASGQPTLAVIKVPNNDVARDVIDAVTPLEPSKFNLYAAEIFEDVALTGKTFATLGDLKPGEVVLTLAFYNTKARTRGKKLKQLAKICDKMNLTVTISDSKNYAQLAGMFGVIGNYLNQAPTKVPVVDGAYIPINILGEYFTAIEGLGKKLNLRMPVYGSVLNDIFNIRPSFDLDSVSGRQLIYKLLKDYTKLVDTLGGNITGGAPEGRFKSAVTRATVNEQLLDMYGQIKTIFDPKNVLNPGVKADTDIKELIENMRLKYNEPIIHE
ncbi:FAD-binding oxidoreductase [Candidatus Saccharibacteria bacterium]|nr:FAD-binding oxidoreductase [Candidatus Saccharibacteria bacterium]